MPNDVITKVAAMEDAGQRVDKWVASWSGLSRNGVQGLIENRALKAGGSIVERMSARVRDGTAYTLTLPPPVDCGPGPEDIPLNIVFEDEHLVVVNKPAGMTVHPAPGSPSGTLVNALLFHAGDTLSGIGGVLRPGIVHRIDRNTSGLLVVAKNDRTHHKLSGQFAAHTVHRKYICLVRGGPKTGSGTVQSRLARSAHNRRKQAVVRGTDGNIHACEHGRHAITHYTLTGGYGQRPAQAIAGPLFSRIECRLETGRTHQIRVHMAHIGCPLLGDPLYGRQRTPCAVRNDSNRSADLLRVNACMKTFKRQALHAAELGFTHPVTREDMMFAADLPEDMNVLLSLLRGLNTA
ncbi:MAG: RluA family pseudouridine synthase [Hyphomonadaceae bacterium]|nr:RluA family pseudouridine synthase [Hyphomonadaceae bacterium]MBC6412776.1 RluA family pseudouridine synthase [Hyphomonadaceae bacterium]